MKTQELAVPDICAPHGNAWCPPALSGSRVAADTTAHEFQLHDLLACCLRTGDPMLWTDFIQYSQPLIAAAVCKSLRNFGRKATVELVDDLVQEIYLKLCARDFKALHRFVCRHAGALYGFLRVVARNVVLDYCRSSDSRKRNNGRPCSNLDEIFSIEAAGDGRSDIESRILLSQINDFAMGLDTSGETRDYDIFRLYYLEGLCARAISQVPGINLTMKGVESAILRLTRKLKLRFNPMNMRLPEG